MNYEKFGVKCIDGTPITLLGISTDSPKVIHYMHLNTKDFKTFSSIILSKEFIANFKGFTLILLYFTTNFS